MEIIKRTSDTKKDGFDTHPFSRSMQVSFNSYGHLAIRFFDSNEPDADKQNDTLIVFDMMESRHIIRFIQERVKSA